jgi:hypothetical protein
LTHRILHKGIHIQEQHLPLKERRGKGRRAMHNNSKSGRATALQVEILLLSRGCWCGCGMLSRTCCLMFSWDLSSVPHDVHAVLVFQQGSIR